jgi:hypothetical protein
MPRIRTKRVVPVVSEVLADVNSNHSPEGALSLERFMEESTLLCFTPEATVNLHGLSQYVQVLPEETWGKCGCMISARGMASRFWPNLQSKGTSVETRWSTSRIS